MTAQNPLVKRILEQMPIEERLTFSEHQIAVLHKAAASLPRASHLIDIRWSIPFPGKGIYVVFFAGKERRSRRRLLYDTKHRLTPKLLTAAVLSVGCIAAVGIVHWQRLAASQQRNLMELGEQDVQFHPTIVPFKENREDCEISGRIWKDEQCYDFEHDPTF